MFGGKDSSTTAKNSEYTLNFSYPDWDQKKENEKQPSDYVYENKKDGRIFLSNSFCEEFQDQPLEKLAHKTVSQVTEFKVTKEKYTTFHDREAYRIEGSGSVDGVKVVLRLLNTRRNNCYFDFVGITPLSSAKTEDPDYEEFLKTVNFK